MNDISEQPILHSPVLAGYSFPGSKYGTVERIRAATEYLVSGSARRVAKSINLPESTLRGWMREPWWTELLAEVRSQKEAEIQAGLTRIVELAMGEVEDRLINGDVKILKTQSGYEQRRVPISGKDSSVIGGIAYDKLRLSLNLPTSIRSDSSHAQLNELAEQFQQIARDYQEKEATVVAEQPRVSSESNGS